MGVLTFNGMLQYPHGKLYPSSALWDGPGDTQSPQMGSEEGPCWGCFLQTIKMLPKSLREESKSF